VTRLFYGVAIVGGATEVIGLGIKVNQINLEFVYTDAISYSMIE